MTDESPDIARYCPFCGGTRLRLGESAIAHHEGGYKTVVYCSECLCEGPLCDSAEAARAAWERRAVDRPLRLLDERNVRLHARLRTAASQRPIRWILRKADGSWFDETVRGERATRWVGDGHGTATPLYRRPAGSSAKFELLREAEALLATVPEAHRVALAERYDTVLARLRAFLAGDAADRDDHHEAWQADEGRSPA